MKKMSYAMLVNAENAQSVRQKLEQVGHWDSSRRLQKLADGLIAIPIKTNSLDWNSIGLPGSQHVSYDIIKTDLPCSKKANIKTPARCLINDVKHFLENSEIEMSSELLKEIPSHWERHGDLCLLPGMAFTDIAWRKLGPALWHCVAKSLSCCRLAQKSSVSLDGFRTPQVSLLFSTDGWVKQTDNGIRYTYDITQCMFSAGNITEKLRIARMNCKGEVVVDLYAGIGYFTLPYLIHAGASQVHACEWNPAAVSALQKNLDLNGVGDRCLIHYGDNRQVCPKGIADRVNLGLIPSSEPAWPVACAALKPSSGGILHIHSNVATKVIKHKTCQCGSTEPCSVVTYASVECTNSKDKSLGGAEVLPSGCAGIVSDGDMLLNSKPNIDSSLQMDSECLSHLLSQQKEIKFTSEKPEKAWWAWSEGVSQQIRSLLEQTHCVEWITRILHIEHVKSYAPHIDHIVLDLECRPTHVQKK